MVSRIGNSLLVLFATLLPCAALQAQSEVESLFQEGVRLLRMGEREQAMVKLRQVLAADPSNKEAFDLWRQADESSFLLLLEEAGDFAKIGEMLLNRAARSSGDLSRDPDAIAGLVEQAVKGNDYGVRERATIELIKSHSEFAVPALCRVIADPDEDLAVNHAILVLTRIGSRAVLPLVETLKSDNELLRRNAASALVLIADIRSAPAFARISKDSSEAVRYVAHRGLAAVGIAAGADPVQLSLAQSASYLSSSSLRVGQLSEVVWNLQDAALTSVDIPAPLYHLELAKRYAEEARRQDPASEEALILMARAYLAQAATVEEYLRLDPENESMQPLQASLPRLKMVAMAAGPDILRRALQESLRDQQVVVAEACIAALAETEDRRDLAGSPLLQAINSGDNRIAYAAALAISKVGAGGPIPASNVVVRILAQAASEESLQLVKVIARGAQASAAAGSQRGLAVDAVDTGKRAISQIYSFPNYDLVVVSDDLPDLHARDVVDLIRRRNPAIKILLLSKDEAAAETYGDSIDGILVGPLTGDSLASKAKEVLADMDARRQTRADRISTAASTALYSLARSGADVVPAMGRLAAQLDRRDPVALPAAMAIGEGGDVGSIPSLLQVLSAQDSSLELKLACARATGRILGRAEQLPSGCFAALMAIATDPAQDQGLRSAVVTALGKGRLSPGNRLKLTEALKLEASGN
ncbi:MAG: HEAT repeat domain-containing protein [Planctomycetota bacterium]|jgi:HEAT repeat protein